MIEGLKRDLPYPYPSQQIKIIRLQDYFLWIFILIYLLFILNIIETSDNVSFYLYPSFILNLNLLNPLLIIFRLNILTLIHFSISLCSLIWQNNFLKIWPLHIFIFFYINCTRLSMEIKGSLTPGIFRKILEKYPDDCLFAKRRKV